MWAKIPTATASIACAACIAAAAVAVPALKSSDELEKTIASEVNLSAVNFTPLLGLASLDGIPAWLDFLATGDVHAFTLVANDPEDPDNPNQLGYAALGGLEAWQNILGGDVSALGDIDAFSAVPSLLDGDVTDIAAFDAIPIYQTLLSGDATIADLAGLESVNALVAFSRFPAEGVDAFVPDAATGNPGYAALSGLATWRDFLQSGDLADLAGIDAFSAIPNWQTFAETGDVSEDGLGGIDAFSALPVFKAATEEPAPAGEEEDGNAQSLAGANARIATESTGTRQSQDPVTPLKQLSSRISSSLPEVKPEVQAPEAAAPDAPEPKRISSSRTTKAKAPAEKTGSKGGSYSGVFKPNNGDPILFGTGRGNGADNGIRGWGDALKKIGIGGGDASSSADAGEGGGASGGE